MSVEVEKLSAELHAIYQAEARRQARTGEDSVRHPDDYDALPEHTKEYDRVLARFILERESEMRQLLWDTMMDDQGRCTNCYADIRGDQDSHEMSCRVAIVLDDIR